jgi:methyl-accepting chemotaxis protein
MADSKTFQRSTVLIKRSLQLKYMGVVFLSVLLASVIVGTDIYYTMAKVLLDENPALVPTLSQLTPILMLKLALYLVLVLLITLYVSHRFAGPIHRFERSAQTVGSGDLTFRVSLRTSDELLELQEEFNGMIANLQSLVQKDRNLAEHAAKAVESTLAGLPKDSSLDSTREELLSIKAELGHLTRSFKV